MLRSWSLVYGVLFITSLCPAGDWPAFRGPRGDGTTDAKNVPVTWSATEHVKWKTPLPQAANGSPIVVGERVFVTTAEDAEGKQRSLLALSLAEGQELWKQTVEVNQKLPTHGTNPYAGTTPVSDGKHVIVWHATGGLHCYTVAGEPVWQRDFGEFRHIWGYGTSPVIHKGRVILHSGPGVKVFVAALKLENGDTVWQHDEPVEGDGSNTPDKRYFGSWATPVIATVDGQEQIFVALPTRLVAMDPETGKLLWWSEGLRHGGGDLAYSSPVVTPFAVFLTGGYGGPALSVKLGGEGNVTETHRLFRLEKQPQSIGTGVVVGGVVYRPNAGPGTIDCIDPLTGKVVWRDRASGNNHWASMVLAEGRIYATDQSGTTVVFKPNKEKYEELATNSLGEPTNATPAVVDRMLIFRTNKHVVCIAQ